MKRISLLLIIIVPGWPTTYIATTASEIQSYTSILEAGDTLLVQEGWYDMNWNISDRQGSASDWIVIQALTDSVVINGINYDNVIDIYGCFFVELKGFEITNSYAGSGIDGIKFRTTSDHIVMEDLHIHDVTGVGISANPAGESFTYLTIRYCHIHDIIDVGEGLYIGNHDGLSPVHHCLVEFNWIHDCHPHKGIQFKRGTYLNVIQDNVVYNCDEAGIVLYKTDRGSSADNNIVQKNVVWNAPEGVFAIGQTDIDNNIIFNCGYGINVRNYSSWGMEDLFIRNNTIYHCLTTCLRLDDWNSASGEMVCINNACYQDDIGQSAIQAPDGIGPGYVAFNRHYGQSQVSGSALGNLPAFEFINPDITPGYVDLYPLSNATLIDSGTSVYSAPPDDFNWRPRPIQTDWDVGAYEWSQNSNPGWPIQEGFKEVNLRVSDSRLSAPKQSYVNTLVSNSDVVFRNILPNTIIVVYDVTGSLIHHSGRVSGGEYRVSNKKIPCGVYFFSVWNESNNCVHSGKISVIR